MNTYQLGSEGAGRRGSGAAQGGLTVGLTVAPFGLKPAALGQARQAGLGPIVRHVVKGRLSPNDIDDAGSPRALADDLMRDGAKAPP